MSAPHAEEALMSELDQASRPVADRARRRLAVCCDGTWNRSDAANITNIEKIARSVRTDPDGSAGTEQLVEYVSGVGVGYTVDRILGGWLGAGVFSNVRAAYRFLALNYADGDEIFLFGFSRGAYTARSVAGMIGAIGLLNRKAMVLGNFGEALARYRNSDRTKNPKDARYKSLEEFRKDCCHTSTPITFLGVFDTVGALGVPTVLRTDHQFHDITLGPMVRCARQALAIDEHRRTFAPCLWGVPDDAPTAVTMTSATGETVTVPRVKQVWFEGVHSDVGGGYPESGLSDTTLLWMTNQASAAGLVFDQDLLNLFLNSDRESKRHKSMKVMYSIANAFERVRPRPEVLQDTFAHGERNLTPTPVPPKTTHGKKPTPTSIQVRLASTARAGFGRDGYRPKNLAAFIESHTPPDPDQDEEKVVGLPRPLGDRHAGAAKTPAAAPEKAQT
jgi:uncharacterized protein (DUF2235 family)